MLEIESHISDNGWDQPARLYALVDTAAAGRQEPQLAAAMGLDSPSEEGSLTPIEQDQVDPDLLLEQVLEQIVWPDEVAGCAAVVERLVLPPDADDEIPTDPAEAQEFAREHPDRQEVRIVAGATRHGATYCALRLRAHDDDQSVVGGADLVPGLLALLGATLTDDQHDQQEDRVSELFDDDPREDEPVRPSRRSRALVITAIVLIAAFFGSPRSRRSTPTGSGTSPSATARCSAPCSGPQWRCSSPSAC